MNLKQMFLEETKKFATLGHPVSYLESASDKDLYETLGRDIVEYVEFDKKLLVSDLRGVKTTVRKNVRSMSDKEVLDSYLFVLAKHIDSLLEYVSNNTLLFS